MQFSWFERARLTLPGRQRSVSGLHIPLQQEDPGWLLAAPSSSSPPGNERSRSPGVHTFLRQRAGLSLCPPPFQPPLCRVPPGTAELKLRSSTKGIPTQVHPHWQRTCGCMRGAGACTLNQYRKGGCFFSLNIWQTSFKTTQIKDMHCVWKLGPKPHEQEHDGAEIPFWFQVTCSSEKGSLIWPEGVIPSDS